MQFIRLLRSPHITSAHLLDIYTSKANQLSYALNRFEDRGVDATVNFIGEECGRKLFTLALVTCTDDELRLLLDSCVSSFNYDATYITPDLLARYQVSLFAPSGK